MNGDNFEIEFDLIDDMRWIEKHILIITLTNDITIACCMNKSEYNNACNNMRFE
jgi:hypothetical protein